MFNKISSAAGAGTGTTAVTGTDVQGPPVETGYEPVLNPVSHTTPDPDPVSHTTPYPFPGSSAGGAAGFGVARVVTRPPPAPEGAGAGREPGKLSADEIATLLDQLQNQLPQATDEDANRKDFVDQAKEIIQGGNISGMVQLFKKLYEEKEASKQAAELLKKGAGGVMPMLFQRATDPPAPAREDLSLDAFRKRQGESIAFLAPHVIALNHKYDQSRFPRGLFDWQEEPRPLSKDFLARLTAKLVGDDQYKTYRTSANLNFVGHALGISDADALRQAFQDTKADIRQQHLAMLKATQAQLRGCENDPNENPETGRTDMEAIF